MTDEKKIIISFLKDELATKKEDVNKILNSNAENLLMKGEHLFRGMIIKVTTNEIFVKFPINYNKPRIGSCSYLCLFLNEQGKDKALLKKITLKELINSYSLGDLEFKPVKYIRDQNSPNYIIGIFTSFETDNIDRIKTYEHNIVYIRSAPPPLDMLSNLISFISYYGLPFINKDKTSIKTDLTLPLNSDKPVEFVADLMDKHEIPIIQGPPGSGKSYLISKIVEKLCSEGFSVLVISQTNRALMEIAKKEPLYSFLKQNLIKKTSLTNTEQTEIPKLEKLCKVIPEKGQCHLATCFKASGSPILDPNINIAKYDYVIMDEASEIFLPMIYCAMYLGKKLALFGDNAQLSPVVTLNKDIIKHRDYNKVVNGLQTLSEIFYTYQILYTYRLPNLAAECTSCFYNYPIISRSNNKNVFFPFDIYGQKLDITFGVFIIFSDLGSKTVSDKAISITIELIKNIRRFALKADISVLAHMNVQVNNAETLSIRNLTEKESQNILFETVHRIQGLTCDYSIFTLTNHGKSLSDTKLFNVGTSRAKLENFIILDSKYLEDQNQLLNLPKEIRKYISLLIERKKYVII